MPCATPHIKKAGSEEPAMTSPERRNHSPRSDPASSLHPIDTAEPDLVAHTNRVPVCSHTTTRVTGVADNDVVQFREPTASVRPASGCTTPLPHTATPVLINAVRKVK